MAIDPAVFAERHNGLSPQEWVIKEAVAQLRAPKLEAERAELETAQAAVKAFGDQDKINAGSDQRKMQDLADAVNKAAAQKTIVHALAARQKDALAFAKGEIDWATFSSGLGNEAHTIIREGDVDGDAVQAALKAIPS